MTEETEIEKVKFLPGQLVRVDSHRPGGVYYARRDNCPGVKLVPISTDMAGIYIGASQQRLHRVPGLGRELVLFGDMILLVPVSRLRHL